LFVAKGKLYQRQVIWEMAAGQAAIFPSWMDLRVPMLFQDASEARAFVDAALLVAGVRRSYIQYTTRVEQ
jgi:hypothetical protein